MFYLKLLSGFFAKALQIFLAGILMGVIEFLKWLLAWLLGKCPKCKKKKVDCECDGTGEDEKDGTPSTASNLDHAERNLTNPHNEEDEEVPDFAPPSGYKFDIEKTPYGFIAMSDETHEVWKYRNDEKRWFITNPDTWQEK